MYQMLNSGQYRSGKVYLAFASRAILSFLTCAMLAGCAGAPKTSQSSEFFETPGRYPAPALDLLKPRVGLPAPSVDVTTGAADDDHVTVDAANELFWVADHTGRFNLIERVRLAQIATEDGSSGAIAPGELLRPIALPGVDYLLLCSIADFSIRGADQPTTVSVANVERLLHVKKPEARVTAQCSIDMRLVDPRTGASVASIHDGFKRNCAPESLGLNFTDSRQAWGQLHLNDEQTSQVLRIALDDAMRKFLPQVDAVMKHPGPSMMVGAPTTNPGNAHASASRPSNVMASGAGSAGAHGTPTTVQAAKIRCPECGFECSPQDEFCPNCGHRLLQNGTRLKQ